jgi:hypothetical protein
MVSVRETISIDKVFHIMYNVSHSIQFIGVVI